MNKTQQFEFIKSLGFETPKYKQLKISEIPQLYNDFCAKKSSLEFACDGIVLVNDTDSWENLEKTIGRNSKNNPEFAVALKQELGSTLEIEVKGIIISALNADRVSFKLDLVPTWFEEQGVTVKACVIPIEELDSGRIRKGSKCLITRSGDVIPKFDSWTYIPEDEDPIKIPEVCPICGERIIRKDNYFYCVNEDCPGKVSSRVEQFFVRQFGPCWMGRETVMKYLRIGVTEFQFYEQDWQGIKELILKNPKSGVSINNFNRFLKAIHQI